MKISDPKILLMAALLPSLALSLPAPISVDTAAKRNEDVNRVREFEYDGFAVAPVSTEDIEVFDNNGVEAGVDGLNPSKTRKRQPEEEVEGIDVPAFTAFNIVTDVPTFTFNNFSPDEPGIDSLPSFRRKRQPEEEEEELEARGVNVPTITVDDDNTDVEAGVDGLNPTKRQEVLAEEESILAYMLSAEDEATSKFVDKRNFVDNLRKEFDIMGEGMGDSDKRSLTPSLEDSISASQRIDKRGVAGVNLDGYAKYIDNLDLKANGIWIDPLEGNGPVGDSDKRGITDTAGEPDNLDSDLNARRIWLDGEDLSQSREEDVGALDKRGVAGVNLDGYAKDIDNIDLNARRIFIDSLDIDGPGRVSDKRTVDEEKRGLDDEAEPDKRSLKSDVDISGAYDLENQELPGEDRLLPPPGIGY